MEALPLEIIIPHIASIILVSCFFLRLHYVQENEKKRIHS